VGNGAAEEDVVADDVVRVGAEPDAEGVCRLCSVPGGGPMSEGAGLFGANGSAKAAMLAVRPSNAAIDFSFIYNSLDGSRRGQSSAIGASSGFQVPHSASRGQGSNRPFIGEP
jgi:hypothetical protein